MGLNPGLQSPHLELFSLCQSCWAGMGGVRQAGEQASVNSCMVEGSRARADGGSGAHGMVGKFPCKIEQAASMLITQPYSIS